MRIAIASFEGVPPQFDDDRRLAAALERRRARATVLPWDDRAAAWSSFDLVVVRSTWDYTRRLAEFLRWAEAIGSRLRNLPELVRWNSDKRYLADLAAAGLPIVPTRFVDPGDPPPALEGEVVVKPAVSAGGRDTGRFAPRAHDLARELLERIAASGRTAMIQPYAEAVDSRGEAALVFVAGHLVHALRKRAVLRPDEVAPVRDDAVGAAEAMYDPGLVAISSAEEAEIEVGSAVLGDLAARFGATPLIARVDLIRDPERGPLLIELEAIEPNLYLELAPRSADLLAEAILAEAEDEAEASRDGRRV